MALPSRHLGLVQAGEHHDLKAFLERAAAWVDEHLDWRRLVALARPARFAGEADAAPLPPLGHRIAVARDQAFAFAYPLVLDGWRRQGAELAFFSPLADQAPAAESDAVYLPGGYPELHAGRLAAADANMQRICAVLAALFDRFAHYGPKFADALAKVQAGEIEGPDGTLQTRSIMIAGLTPEESVRIQQEGIGPLREMGCGIFIAHKGIDAVKKAEDDA